MSGVGQCFHDPLDKNGCDVNKWWLWASPCPHFNDIKSPCIMKVWRTCVVGFGERTAGKIVSAWQNKKLVWTSIRNDFWPLAPLLAPLGWHLCGPSLALAINWEELSVCFIDRDGCGAIEWISFSWNPFLCQVSLVKNISIFKRETNTVCSLLH